MSIEFYTFLFFSGLITGVFSGLLGIGGALIIIPVLLYLPPVFKLPVLSIHTITGLTALQTTFGTFASSLFHRKYGEVNDYYVTYIGIGIAVAAFTGAILSQYFSESLMLWIYFFFIASAAVLLLLKKETAEQEGDQDTVRISKRKVALFGMIVGLPAGILGFAGSVVIIPLLNTVFSVPLRVCISTGTHIAFIASLMSFLGKFSSGQVHLISSLIIATSAMIGALIGSQLNKKVNSVVLKYTLLSIILLTMMRVLYNIIFAA